MNYRKNCHLRTPNMKIIRYIFNFSCFSIAFGMTVFWCIKFFMDEDLCKINFKPFDTSFSNGGYPMFSFCFFDPFIASKLREYEPTLSPVLYSEILSGDRSYNGSKEINFDDVTIDLAQFFVSDAITFKNGTIAHGAYPNFLNNLPQVTYADFYEKTEWFIKCFGLKIDHKDVMTADFGFNSSIFLNNIPNGYFSVVPHLPNKITIIRNSGKIIRIDRMTNQEYKLYISLDQVEILKRRNKTSEPCVSDDLNYDDTIFNDHLRVIGCKAAYHNSSRNWKICETAEKIKAARRFNPDNYRDACTSAEVLAFGYEVSEENRNGADWFQVNIEYPKRIKEITMVEEVDFQSMIGNAGGYIGLFLGNFNVLTILLLTSSK